MIPFIHGNNFNVTVAFLMKKKLLLIAVLMLLKNINVIKIILAPYMFYDSIQFYD